MFSQNFLISAGLLLVVAAHPAKRGPRDLINIVIIFSAVSAQDTVSLAIFGRCIEPADDR